MNAIFDLDGTLALVDHRRHFVERPAKDWDAFYRACVGDSPNNPIIMLTRLLYIKNIEVRIWSGRSDVVKDSTIDWLAKYNVMYHHLKMRRDGDYTPDEKLKEQWLDELIINSCTPFLVFDDRDKVVAMWRRRGITCCQVAEGEF